MKKIIEAVVVVSLAAMGCGLPEEEGPGIASVPAEVRVARPSRSQLRPASLAGASADGPALEVSGSGSFPAGLRLRVITGLMSCGFGETGRADTLTAPDAFAARVPQQSSYGMNAVLLWLDRDGDGRCGSADTTARFTFYGAVATAGLDLSTAPEAGCIWFE